MSEDPERESPPRAPVDRPHPNPRVQAMQQRVQSTGNVRLYGFNPIIRDRVTAIAALSQGNHLSANRDALTQAGAPPGYQFIASTNERVFNRHYSAAAQWTGLDLAAFYNPSTIKWGQAPFFIPLTQGTNHAHLARP